MDWLNEAMERSKAHPAPYAFLLLVLAAILPPAFAAEKPRLVVVAIDESESMRQSDPGRARIEAAKMLMSLASGSDEVGVIGFGTSARWVQKPAKRTDSVASALENLGQSDAHTNFELPLKLFADYLHLKDADYLATRDVSLVVLTDGEADPAPEPPSQSRKAAAEQNRVAALAVARGIRTLGRLYAIGLGKQADVGFLGDLVHESGGSRASAGSPGDLADAFLQILTRVFSLPIYARQDRPGVFQWSGKPDLTMVFFFGDAPSSSVGGEKSVFSSTRILVSEPRADANRVTLNWRGSGVAFLAVRDSLRLVAGSPLPASILTDVKKAVSLGVYTAHGPLDSAYFLQNSTVDLESLTRDSRFLSPLTPANGGRFAGDYSLDTPGDYKVYARLTAPYGEIRTFLGDLKASSTPVLLPSQVTLSVFDPLPRSWFSRPIELRSALPTGGASVRFEGSTVARSAPASLIVEPSRAFGLRLFPGNSARPGDTDTVNYTADWGEGQEHSVRQGAISVQIRQMGVLELLSDKWAWVGAIVAFVLFVGYALAVFRPRPLSGCLTVVHNGTIVVKLDLPREKAWAKVKVTESANPRPPQTGEVVITGSRDRDLVTLRSRRKGRRWGCVAEPAETLLTAHGALPGNADLSDRRYAQFHTRDNTIEIKFYSV